MQREIRGGAVAFKRAYYDKSKKRSFQSMLATISLEHYAVPLDLRHKFSEIEIVEADDFLRSDEARDALAKHLKAKDARKRAPKKRRSHMKAPEVVFEDGDAAYDAFQIALAALARAIDKGYQPEYELGVRSNVGAVVGALAQADLIHFHSSDSFEPSTIKDIKARLDAGPIRDALKLPHNVVAEIARPWACGGLCADYSFRDFELWVAVVAEGKIPMPTSAKQGWEDHCRRHVAKWIAGGVGPHSLHFDTPFLTQDHTKRLRDANDAAIAIDLHEREGYVPGVEKLAEFDPFCIDGEPVIEKVDPIAEARELVEWAGVIYDQRSKFIGDVARGNWVPTLMPKQSSTYKVGLDYKNWCEANGLELL